jgi:hypothetical protein
VFAVDSEQAGLDLLEREDKHDEAVNHWAQAALALTPSVLRELEETRSGGETVAIATAPQPVTAHYTRLEGSAEQRECEFTHVAVVVWDGKGKCVLLDRSPASAVARADTSVRALPSLQVTDALQGKYRAQHALQMLFGPIRSFSELRGAYDKLCLRGVVETAESKPQKIGVYECIIDIDPTLLNKVFKERRCTPSMEGLFPDFSICPASDTAGVSKLEAMMIAGVCGSSDDSPTVARVTIAPPSLPTKQIQDDISTDAGQGGGRKKGGKLMPGEQPSGREQFDADMTADFSHGGFVPRVRDPEAFLKAMIPKAALLAPEEIAKQQREDYECRFIRLTVTEDKEGLIALDAQATDEERRETRAWVIPWLTKHRNSYDFRVVDDVLYNVDNYGASNSREEPILRVVLPGAMRRDFVVACHDSVGHPGVKRTLRIAAARAWWIGMRKTVEDVVGKCPTCLFNKVLPHRGEQHIPDNGSEPWHSVQVDIVHLHKTESGMEKAVVFYDRFSKDVEVFPVKADVDTATILNLIIFEIVPRHGWFRVLYTDRGSNLISEDAKKFYKMMGIDLRAADAHMHTAVAGCERFNATLRMLARAAHFDTGYQWDVMLPLLVAWYKQSVQTSTGYSPFYLNHGRDALQPWDIKKGPHRPATDVPAYIRAQFSMLHLARLCASHDVMVREEKRKEAHAAKYRTVKFKKDNRVLVLQAGRKTKMHMPYVGPFKIAEVLERDRYRLVGRQGAKHLHHEFHVSRLKLWPEGADEEDIYLDEDYFDVDSVVDHRKTKAGVIEYRVRWTGYTAADDSWMPLSDMNAACARAALDYMNSASSSTEANGEADNGEPAAEADNNDGTPDEGVQPPAPEQGTGVQGASKEQTDRREERLRARQARMGPALPLPQDGAPEMEKALRRLQAELATKQGPHNVTANAGAAAVDSVPRN